MKDIGNCEKFKAGICNALLTIFNVIGIIGDEDSVGSTGKSPTLDEDSRKSLEKAGEKLQDWIDSPNIGYEECLGSVLYTIFMNRIEKLKQLLHELLNEHKPVQKIILEGVTELAKIMQCGFIKTE